MGGLVPINAASAGIIGFPQAGVAASGSGSEPVTIGGVTFRSEEVPNPIPIGAGEQMLVVTDLIGGGRVVQALGVKPKSVTWNGRFITAGQVFAKVRSLRLYMTTGVEVLFSWWGEIYFCRVKDFTPTFNHQNLCDYSITIEITRDKNGAFTVAANTSIDQQVQALLKSATVTNNAILTSSAAADDGTDDGIPNINFDADPQSFQSALQQLNSAVAAAGPIAANITTAGPPIVAAADNATTAVGKYIAAISPTDANYANASLLQASTKLISSNVTRGQSPQSTRVQGQSLFAVAAQTYGDPSKAYALANANGLPAPFTTAIASQVIALPPFGVQNGIS